MFTGIIETLGEVVAVERDGSNLHFDVKSDVSHELKIDQSVAHNGVCLTVVQLADGLHRVTAIDETLQKTTLGNWEVGTLVNIERCMVANGRFDGHVVQGHVDQIGTVEAVAEQDGSWLFDFSYDPSLGNVTVEKGSICVNGTSLTCFNSGEGRFRVAIIPYTYDHTCFKTLKQGDKVNLEFDIIGKYVKRLLGQS
ncbi:riboflavin synthase [Roseivirga pacifica]|uniref:riboflavin synthase n=1 Tax=Roseivirga pacifica TaxID=1267423 RepID=UPI0020962BE4|nr:riboflavin synthase [Roseivirga pacifica]MCO6360981.1 riboflavin synthase [Roseivirga pacifica]MCO6368870.1 riboflavin synthase [Roseivirga pacifica]MCO6373013.1 riboflavin synthase [Roseivirga pacifica]MCO6373093.1 riboflavin synthase [Roseivirga pacifica]MCO6377650.1 riboflavin synthase [Roseivirga pacifica]